MRKRDKRLDGYNYTAGELLRGTPTAFFEEKTKLARTSSTHKPFDDGMEDALHDWKIKTKGQANE